MSSNRVLISLFEQHARRFESEYASSRDSLLLRHHGECARKLRYWMNALRSRNPETHEFLPSRASSGTGDFDMTRAALRMEGFVAGESEGTPPIWYYTGEMLNGWGRSVLKAMDRRTTTKH